MAETTQRVLVVEDDPGVAILQRRRLERAGFTVEVATDVEAALERLDETGADLVLADYRLGESSGLDLQRRFRAAGYDMPVIIISGAMTDEAVIEALRAGVRDVIVKTTDYLDYLPDAVRGVLDQVAAAPGVLPQTTRRRRVLIVEDDPGTATLESRQLERAGYDVVVAHNPDGAVSAVQAGGVNLAVLDLKLPGGISGIDVYKRLRSDGWNIPAILVTAFGDQTAAIRALRAGIRDFVPKTVDFLEYLPTAVDRVFEQVRLERKLVESELRLASIVGTTMDAIMLCDGRLHVVLFNPSAESMFGWTAADAMRQPLETFIPGMAIDESAGPGGLRQRTEVEGIRADGGIVPIEVSVSDVVVNGERLFTVIARDVSERRRTEAELREADRRKDEFLGMLAHELRNPLAAIMTAGDVLHNVVQDGEGQRLTSVVRRQTRTLARMVDDLLDVSRVTLGKIQLACEPLALGEVIARAGEHVQSSAAAAGLTLEIVVPDEPIRVSADPTRLEQVLMNLLTNAVKFTPAGGRITMWAAGEAGEAVVRVRDSGIGIPAEVLPHVFDLFVQADTTLDRAQSGLGIGLALVRQLVALHGGRVSAASGGAGQGSEFAVYLPMIEAVTPTATAPLDVRRAAAGGLKVLVVDDQADVADLFALFVSGAGHDAEAVYSGDAALVSARARRPDVMFVDVGMPLMNGYDLARAVRADPSLVAVRLVALTGYGRDEDRARAMAAGFDRHLVKPVDEAKLRAVLEEFAAEPGPR